MNASSPLRMPACVLFAWGMAMVACPARADFIYARLVPGPGVEANGASTSVDVSAGGRTVVFASDANN
jgi:hypothetical protein